MGNPLKHSIKGTIYNLSHSWDDADKNFWQPGFTMPFWQAGCRWTDLMVILEVLVVFTVTVAVAVAVLIVVVVAVVVVIVAVNVVVVLVTATILPALGYSTGYVFVL